MIYSVRHRTTYEYEDPVSVSHHVIRLTPRNLPRQTCRKSKFPVAPAPPATASCNDYFGNGQTFFTLQEPHERLIVEANSELEVFPAARPDLSASPRWESVPRLLDGDHSAEGLDAYHYVFVSQRVRTNRELADYARESFPEGRPLLEAAFDLTRRIHSDFIFDSKATEVSTPVETFFEKRRGVCQDFAHLQIACMRLIGLPDTSAATCEHCLPRDARG